MDNNDKTAMNHEEKSIYPKEIVELAQNSPYYVRMNDFTTSACVKGPCGDSMEFYLVIRDGIIKKVSFYTDGCISTRACGSVSARFCEGKEVEETLGLSAQIILERLSGLPKHHSHCALLAVTAFYRAIADYLLMNYV